MIYNNGTGWMPVRRRAKIKKPSYEEIVEKICNLYDETAAMYGEGLAYTIAWKYESYCCGLYGSTTSEWGEQVCQYVEEHCKPVKKGEEHPRLGYYALVKPYDDGTVMPKCNGEGLKYERIFLELSPRSVTELNGFNRTFKYCNHDDLKRFQEAVNIYNAEKWTAGDWAPYFVKLDWKEYTVSDAREDELARDELEKHLKWFKMLQELTEELNTFCGDYYYIEHKRPSGTVTVHLNGIDEKLRYFMRDDDIKDELGYLNDINWHTRDVTDWVVDWSSFISNVVEVYEGYLYPEKRELINKLYE